jgi:hypothetical protein
VVALLASGMTLREIADGWFNLRKGKPYHHTHVFFVSKVFRLFSQLNKRPLFLDLYNQEANKSRWCFGNGDDEW